MSRGRHSAAPATARSFRLPALPTLPVRSLKLPALALVTLLGAGAVGAGPQPAEGNPDLAPLSVEPTAGASVERGTEPPAARPSASRPHGAPGAAGRRDRGRDRRRAGRAGRPDAAAPAARHRPALDHRGRQRALRTVRGRRARRDDRVRRCGRRHGRHRGRLEPGRVGRRGCLDQVELPRAVPARGAPGRRRGGERVECRGVSDAACSVSTGIESSLRANARAVYRSVCANFPRSPRSAASAPATTATTARAAPWTS